MSIAIDRPSMLHEYAIVRREIATPDVERADAEVVEVTVRWGRTVLGVAHVPLDGSLKIGEDDRGAMMVPSELLGASSFTLVERGKLNVPEGAKLEASSAPGAQSRGATGAMGASEIGKTPVRFVLGEGNTAYTVQVTRVAAARSVPRKTSLKKGILAIAGASLLAHVGIMTALAFSPGASLDDDQSSLDKSTQATLIQLQNAVSAREIAEEEIPTAGGQTSIGGEDGGAHKGPTGQAGNPASKPTNGAYAIQGPAMTQQEHLAAVRSMIDSNTYGAIGALSSVLGTNKGMVDMYSAFNDEVGKDPISAQGNLYGDHLGDSFGYDGLGLTGTGPGGNGWTDGLGLGPVGGFGHGPGNGGPGWGNCPAGTVCGFGMGPTIDASKHKTEGGTKIGGDVDSVSAGYPPEVVKRIVRANFPRFRQCYESALRTDPELRGTVSTRFIIDQTGAVETASLGGGTMSNASVNACVVSVFSSLSFPAPEVGKAMVTYPISFDHE